MGSTGARGILNTSHIFYDKGSQVNYFKYMRQEFRLNGERVVIRLLPQSSPTGTRAINQMLLQLNHMQARVPGSQIWKQ